MRAHSDYEQRRGRRPRRITGFRGLLRFLVGDVLVEGPASGSEIADEIERLTGWRPAPGSIYPLLARLEGEGLIQLAEQHPSILKRYTLTFQGRVLEERRKQEATPRVRAKYYAFPQIYSKFFMGMSTGFLNSQTRLLRAIEEIHPWLLQDPVAASTVQRLLESTTEQLEDVKRRLDPA